MSDIPKSETRDEVLAEVRRIKESLAAARGFDVRRILDEARKHQEAGQRRVLPRPAVEVVVQSTS